MVEVNSYLIDLERRNAELNKENASLMHKIRHLETEIANHARWEEEKAKYDLVQDAQFSALYRLRGTKQFFCPKCFNDDRVPIHVIWQHRGSYFDCLKCKSKINFDIGVLERLS